MTWSMQDEARRLDLEQARQDLRHLDPGEAALAGLRVAQPDRDRQAERRDVRERMARIDRERRQDREDLVEEALAERVVVLGDRGVVDELDPLGGERPADRDVDRRVVGDEVEDALAGGGQLLVGGPAVGRAGDLAGLDLLAQAGDPDLEELVEVAGEDRQELDPLEQRVALVARLVQDPRVELEPRQLAVQVRERRLRAGRAARAWRDRRSSGRAGAPVRSRPSEGSWALYVEAVAMGGPAGEDSTRPRSVLRDVPPLAAARIDPDAHRPARRRVDEDLVAPPEPRLERGARRLAAAGPVRLAGPVGGLGAVADPLDERADDERAADADEPERR